MEYGTLAEKKALSARSGYWAGTGALLQILSFLVSRGTFRDPAATAIVGTGVSIVSVVGAVLWVVGCAYYARSKGWSWILGILGILTCIGAVVLVLLPDKWKRALDANPGAGLTGGPADLTNYPR